MLLFKILGRNKSNEDELLDILAYIKTIRILIYGVDNNIEGLKKNKVSLLILPADISMFINKFRKIAKVNNIEIVFVSKKEFS